MQATVEADRQRLESHLEEKEAEIVKLTDQVNELKRKARETWKTNCEALVLYDEECIAKDAIIADLRSNLSVTGVAVPATMPPLITLVIPPSPVVP